MAFPQPEKAFCVLKFAKTKSWTLVQREFRRKFGKEVPGRNFLWMFVKGLVYVAPLPKDVNKVKA